MPSLNPSNYPNLWQITTNASAGSGGGLLAISTPTIVVSTERFTNESDWGFIDFKVNNNYEKIKDDFYAQGKNLKGMEIYFKKIEKTSAEIFDTNNLCCWLNFLGAEQFAQMDSYSPDISLCSCFIRPGQSFFLDDARLFGEIRGVLGLDSGVQSLPFQFQAKFVVNSYFG